MQCGAKTRSGSPCSARAMPNGRCRMHGGTSLAGVASPTLTTGRYSKYLPERLLERYQDAAQDADLLAMRQELALLDARLADVLQRVDTGESGALWKNVQDAFRDFERERNSEREFVAWKRLASTIQDGMADYAAWQEVGRLIDQRQRLAESERKRLVDMRQMITAERAMVLLAAITDTIRRHVSDRSTLAAISADLARLAAVESGPAPLAGT
jgi:hypothetical protein